MNKEEKNELILAQDKAQDKAQDEIVNEKISNMNEEEKLQKDILFQIDMQLYDEFNDNFCEMNDNLGTIYTYKDIDDLEKLEKETEIKLLRKAIEKQQKEIEKQQKEIKARLKEIDSLYKMMSVKDDEIKYLEIKLEQYGEEYQILKDDIEGHNVVYVDTPEFEENYISKDKIKEKIEEIISYAYTSVEERDCQDYAIQVLKELIGE